MFCSVILLYERDHKLSPYMVKISVPVAGHLVVEPVPQHYRRGEKRARLMNSDGRDLLPNLDACWLAACGPKGMLLEGHAYRMRNSKSSHRDRQAWWVRAPPVTQPLIDHGARVAAVVADLRARGHYDDWGSAADSLPDARRV